MKAMLADTATNIESLLTDDNFWAEQKLDGHRVLIHVTPDGVEFLNRNGKDKVTGNLNLIKRDCDRLVGAEVFLDGELMQSGDLWIFDIPTLGALPLSVRRENLKHVFEMWSPSERIRLTDICRTEQEKRNLLDAAMENQAEGVMLKDHRSIYRPGSRSESWLKYKFDRDIECIILETGVDGHDNVVLAVLDPDSNRVVNIGRASALGKRPTPERGQVWTVRYLYAVDPTRPRLYQPRLMKLRDDKKYEECLMDQLKGSFTDKTVILERTRD